MSAPMMPAPTPLRAEKQAKANMRALEEQAERTADVRAVASSTGTRVAPSEEVYEGYGRKMASHLRTLQGGAYHAAFMRGLSMPAYGNPDQPAGAKFDSNVPQRAAATPALLKKGGAKKAMKGGVGAGIGAGPLKLEISHLEKEASSDSEKEKELEGGRIVGGAKTGRYEGEGKPDRRKARGALLKKVMAEHGLSMAQASAYIKAHGLTY